MNTQTNTERYLTYEQAASLLCMSTGGLRNRMCRGEPMPPSVKIGRRRLFPESALHTWLAERRESGEEI
ncbi:helix-turn-helix transcriptional regulator [Pleionea litopenaei]|uniref:Helix-turn-helix domain-containing protein n=1 Tax=Pleionea litopenaei TaxID=3070815 RepID=A0AA51RQ99_9GAMM|nr:helix-turn-helix domain-containing protein [Pleionea sp. HL-JVS1]WMS85605.1 helix-turn-helix domain-containing protein [Pleionea sp. HL-JVS1]